MACTNLKKKQPNIIVIVRNEPSIKAIQDTANYLKTLKPKA